MPQTVFMRVIAHVRSEFPSKFAVPRQSGLVEELEASLIFQPEFRNPDALRGLESFSHVWLVWVFHQTARKGWSPTVRPPRLGGNERRGVFATRSPFRPNPVGLSAVRLAGIEQTKALGPVLHIRGADLMDGTPVLDIKPYLHYADCLPDATGGFASAPSGDRLEVVIPQELLAVVPAERREALRRVLEQDPRPRYQTDPKRVYGFGFAGLEVQFSVEGTVLTVKNIFNTR